MIRITVGGERREVEDNTTVEELLFIEHVEMPEYVSVSVNEEFVLREDFGGGQVHHRRRRAFDGKASDL